MSAENKIAIIRVEPLNFGIRNEHSKNAIINKFQMFLNSLDFPVQILIKSNPLNIDSYIHELEQKVDALAGRWKSDILPEHLKSYKEHLLETIKQQSVLDRTFDII